MNVEDPEAAVRIRWVIPVNRMFGGSGIHAEGLCFATEIEGRSVFEDGRSFAR